MIITGDYKFKKIYLIVPCLIAVIITGLWFNLEKIIGVQKSKELKLAFGHILGPELISQDLQEPTDKENKVLTLNLALENQINKPLNEFEQIELKGKIETKTKDYSGKIYAQIISDKLNPSFAVFNVSLKGKSFFSAKDFYIIPPTQKSQVDNWLKTKIASELGFGSMSEYIPIKLKINNKYIGLRYIVANSTPSSIDLSDNPYLKLFCRDKPELIEYEKTLTGASLSKIPIRPVSEWGIVTYTMGESVSGNEFARVYELASKREISLTEQQELENLVDLEAFAKYFALMVLVDQATLDSIETPPSFEFDYISGEVKPSFQVCGTAGFTNYQDEWFKKLIYRLSSNNEFLNYFENTITYFNSEKFRNKLSSLAMEIESDLKPLLTSSPYKYYQDQNNQYNYLYNYILKDSLSDLKDSLLKTDRVRSDFIKPIKASINLKNIPQPKDITINVNQNILEDLVIRKGQKLIVKEGVTLRLAPQTSILISGGIAEFNGTEQKPIYISKIDNTPYGAIIFSNKAKGELKNVVIDGGSDAYKEFVRYEGMVNAYNSELKLNNVEINNGLLVLEKAKAEMNNVSFKNYLDKLFISNKSQVKASNLQHLKITPKHTEKLLAQTAQGVPHLEREFKYTIDASFNSAQLKLIAQELQQEHLTKVLADKEKWKAVEFSSDGLGFRPDNKVGEFAYADIYIDTPDNLNFKHDISYRYRYRFENLKTHNDYLKNPNNPKFWPYRLEYQGKIGRGHSAPGFSEVYEARFEFRKQSLPFNEEYLAPWTPWNEEIYLPYMYSGNYKNLTTVSGQEVYKFLKEQTGKKEFEFQPRVVVITERLRQHLNIKTEWGSGPNPDQSNIITLDRSEIFDAENYLKYLQLNRYGEKAKVKPKVLGVVTEMEIEFERNVSRELDKKLAIAIKENNKPEVERLTRARDAFVTDLETLKKEIVEFYKEKGINVFPGGDSKYLNSYKILEANKHRKAKILTVDQRLTLNNSSNKVEIDNMLKEIAKDTTKKGRKFVFSTDQYLIIALKDWEDIGHNQLGKGRDIQTSGYIRYLEPDKIEIYNQSGHYCPSFESLNFVKDYIEQRSDISVQLKNKPHKYCVK